MARDMTARELRALLEGVPDHWPVMMMVSDNSESWDCMPVTTVRSHIDASEGCEGVWLYSMVGDTDANPDVDWQLLYGMPARMEGEDSNDYAARVNRWERAHPEWYKVEQRG